MLVFISYIGNKLNLTNIAIPLNNIFISIQATHNTRWHSQSWRPNIDFLFLPFCVNSAAVRFISLTVKMLFLTELDSCIDWPVGGGGV